MASVQHGSVEDSALSVHSENTGSDNERPTQVFIEIEMNGDKKQETLIIDPEGKYERRDNELFVDVELDVDAEDCSGAQFSLRSPRIPVDKDSEYEVAEGISDETEEDFTPMQSNTNRSAAVDDMLTEIEVRDFDDENRFDTSGKKFKTYEFDSSSRGSTAEEDPSGAPHHKSSKNAPFESLSESSEDWAEAARPRSPMFRSPDVLTREISPIGEPVQEPVSSSSEDYSQCISIVEAANLNANKLVENTVITSTPRFDEQKEFDESSPKFPLGSAMKHALEPLDSGYRPSDTYSTVSVRDEIESPVGGWQGKMHNPQGAASPDAYPVKEEVIEPSFKMLRRSTSLPQEKSDFKQEVSASFYNRDSSGFKTKVRSTIRSPSPRILRRNPLVSSSNTGVVSDQDSRSPSVSELRSRFDTPETDTFIKKKPALAFPLKLRRGSKGEDVFSHRDSDATFEDTKLPCEDSGTESMRGISEITFANDVIEPEPQITHEETPKYVTTAQKYQKPLELDLGPVDTQIDGGSSLRMQLASLQLQNESLRCDMKQSLEKDENDGAKIVNLDSLVERLHTHMDRLEDIIEHVDKKQTEENRSHNSATDNWDESRSLDGSFVSDTSTLVPSAPRPRPVMIRNMHRRQPDSKLMSPIHGKAVVDGTDSPSESGVSSKSSGMLDKILGKMADISCSDAESANEVIECTAAKLDGVEKWKYLSTVALSSQTPIVLQLQTSLANAIRENEAMTSVLREGDQELEKKCEELTQKLVAANQALQVVGKAKVDLELNKENASFLLAENEQLRAENDQLRINNDQLNGENERLSERVKTLEEECDTLKKELSSSEARHATTTQSITTLENSLSEVCQEKSVLQADISHLKEDYNQLRSSMDYIANFLHIRPDLNPSKKPEDQIEQEGRQITYDPSKDSPDEVIFPSSLPEDPTLEDLKKHVFGTLNRTRKVSDAGVAPENRVVNGRHGNSVTHSNIIQQSELVLKSLSAQEQFQDEPTQKKMVHWQDVKDSIASSLSSESATKPESVSVRKTSGGDKITNGHAPIVEGVTNPEVAAKILKTAENLQEQLGVNVKVVMDPQNAKSVTLQVMGGDKDQADDGGINGAQEGKMEDLERQAWYQRQYQRDCRRIEEEYEALKKKRLAMLLEAYTGKTSPLQPGSPRADSPSQLQPHSSALTTSTPVVTHAEPTSAATKPTSSTQSKISSEPNSTNSQPARSNQQPTSTNKEKKALSDQEKIQQILAKYNIGTSEESPKSVRDQTSKGKDFLSTSSSLQALKTSRDSPAVNGRDNRGFSPVTTLYGGAHNGTASSNTPTANHTRPRPSSNPDFGVFFTKATKEISEMQKSASGIDHLQRAVKSDMELLNERLSDMERAQRASEDDDDRMSIASSLFEQIEEASEREDPSKRFSAMKSYRSALISRYKKAENQELDAGAPSSAGFQKYLKDTKDPQAEDGYPVRDRNLPSSKDNWSSDFRTRSEQSLFHKDTQPVSSDGFYKKDHARKAPSVDLFQHSDSQADRHSVTPVIGHRQHRDTHQSVQFADVPSRHKAESEDHPSKMSIALSDSLQQMEDTGKHHTSVKEHDSYEPATRQPRHKYRNENPTKDTPLMSREERAQLLSKYSGLTKPYTSDLTPNKPSSVSYAPEIKRSMEQIQAMDRDSDLVVLKTGAIIQRSNTSTPVMDTSSSSTNQSISDWQEPRKYMNTTHSTDRSRWKEPTKSTTQRGCSPAREVTRERREDRDPSPAHSEFRESPHIHDQHIRINSLMEQSSPLWHRSHDVHANTNNNSSNNVISSPTNNHSMASCVLLYYASSVSEKLKRNLTTSPGNKPLLTNSDGRVHQKSSVGRHLVG